MVKILTGSTKVLILNNGLVCPDCQNELSSYFINTILDVADIISMNGYYNDEFDEYNQELVNEFNMPKMNNPKVISQEKNKVKAKINPYKIYKKISSKVIGQDEQIKNIISIIIRNNMTDNAYVKSNIFLIGGTGNGKSETIKQIAKELDIPYVIEDSSKYTQEGYVGDSVQDAVIKLINEAKDLKRAERGIIIFDEIDKKTDNGDRSNVATTSVQDSLLKMLEGTNIHTNIGTINTEHITFILIGACEAAFTARKKRLTGKGKIGFSNIEKNKTNEYSNPNFIPQDLVEAGFKSEFVGRIDYIQEFKPMDKDMAIRIINESKISIFNFYLSELKKYKVNVVMNRDEVVESIASRAVQLGTGVRGIRQIVVEMFKNIFSKVIISDASAQEEYECIIDKDIVYDNSKFKLCKRKRQN